MGTYLNTIENQSLRLLIISTYNVNTSNEFKFKSIMSQKTVLFTELHIT